MEDTATNTSEKKRRRPALACEQCRRRKIKCDRVQPCTNCVKAHRGPDCTFKPDDRVPNPPRAPEGITEAAADASSATYDGLRAAEPHSSSSSYSTPVTGPWSLHASDAANTPASLRSGPATVEVLTDRVRHLEQQLSRALKRDNEDPLKDTQWSTGSMPIFLQQGTLSKTRYFGQSHWMNAANLFPLVRLIQKETTGKNRLAETLGRCKTLGRSIKAHRVPSLINVEFGKNMPPKELADKLVHAYFRTFETVYRILHVPSFWLDYNRYWENPEAANPFIIIQIQLCMAIGACFHDQLFSHRDSAAHWIYEAHLWLMTPPEKARMNIPGLQIMCLLHLARETTAIGGDLTWISAGGLLRLGMYMGLHRDPVHLPKLKPLLAEIRRRLWATILEITLQSSIDSGGPVLIAMTDFDTQTPGNFDDHQLMDLAEGKDPTPMADSSYTETSVQIALAKSYPIRLAIARYINDFRTINNYDETLRLNAELTKACRTLTSTLQKFPKSLGLYGERPSPFQMRAVEHISHRMFLVINHPWFSASQQNPKYYFSRKVCVETALKLVRAWTSQVVVLAKEATTPAATATWEGSVDDFARLCINGTGSFRSVSVQSILVVALELTWQLEEDQPERAAGEGGTLGTVDLGGPPGLSLGGAASQELLFDAIDTACMYSELRIRSGETNIKGHIAMCAIAAQAHAMQRGPLEIHEIENIILDEAIASGNRCWEILKRIAERKAQTAKDRPQDSLVEASYTDGQSGGGIFNIGSMAQNSLAMDVDQDWAWEDFMKDQGGFNFNFNFNNFESPL